MGRSRWPPPDRRWHAGILLMAIVFCLCASTADGMPQTKPAAGGPDLQPTNLATEPMVPHESEVVHASARVENRGDVGAEAATIELRDHRPNGDLIAVGSVNLPAALAPGESVVVQLPAFLAAAVGVHTLTVEVTNVVPADADPTNDAASLQMRVDPERVPPPPPPPPSVQPLFVVGRFDLAIALGMGVALSLLVAYRVRTRPHRVPRRVRKARRVRRPRPYGPLDPPAPDPPDPWPPPTWPP